MDGRGGCCIARYAGNMYDLSKIDRIMLRYRPIAPKPATNSSCSGSSTPENSSTYVKTGRGKRRYVRNNSSKKRDSINNGSVTKRSKSKCKSGGGKRLSSSPEENESNGRSTVSTGSVSGGDGIVTLSLLPETPEGKESSSPAKFTSHGAVERVPLPHFGIGRGCQQRVGMAALVAQQPVRVVGTWVTVESVITETWVGAADAEYGGLLGCTDEEKVMSLERDTCPGFISDGGSRVTWVNRAYNEMIVGQEEIGEEVLVWLVMQEGLEASLPRKNRPAAFTCRVRVVTCGKEKSSLTLPCDVWRLDGGQGFAWRLDTKAALSLGL